MICLTCLRRHTAEVISQPTTPDAQFYWPDPDSAVLNCLGVTLFSNMCLNLTSLKQTLPILVKKKSAQLDLKREKYITLVKY